MCSLFSAYLPTAVSRSGGKINQTACSRKFDKNTIHPPLVSCTLESTQMLLEFKVYLPQSAPLILHSKIIWELLRLEFKTTLYIESPDTMWENKKNNQKLYKHSTVLILSKFTAYFKKIVIHLYELTDYISTYLLNQYIYIKCNLKIIMYDCYKSAYSLFFWLYV